MGYSVDRTVPHVLPDFLKGLVLRWSSLASDSTADDPMDSDPRYVVYDPEDATIVTSRLLENSVLHRVVLDIDFPVHVIPSSTEGHFHLVFDHTMTWGPYMKLLNDLADAGVIERGYADASISRGYSSIRLPWIKKVQ